MKVSAVGCSLSSSSGAMDDGMTRKRRSHRACATSDEMPLLFPGNPPWDEIKGGDRGTAGIMFAKTESTGRHATPVDTGTTRLVAKPRRSESSRQPGDA